MKKVKECYSKSRDYLIAHQIEVDALLVALLIVNIFI